MNDCRLITNVTEIEYSIVSRNSKILGLFHEDPEFDTSVGTRPASLSQVKSYIILIWLIFKNGVN